MNVLYWEEFTPDASSVLVLLARIGVMIAKNFFEMLVLIVIQLYKSGYVGFFIQNTINNRRK
jgi:hypothetical protein